jgi:hypothetical protein
MCGETEKSRLLFINIILVFTQVMKFGIERCSEVLMIGLTLAFGHICICA